MTRISLDTRCYYFTSVTHHRLSVFRTDKFKELMCKALNEARSSGGLLFFAYVIMFDHFHIITDGKRKISDTLRYLNGITARRLIDHLKENGPEESLRKLQMETKAGDYVEIIGEAAKSLSQDIRDEIPEIEWREIMRMRDKIVHHYFRIDLETVWQTAKHDVPALAEALQRIDLRTTD